MEQDPLMQPLERGRRNDADIDERIAMTLEGAQGLDMMAGPIERRHQQFHGAVVQWILVDHRLGESQRVVGVTALQLSSGEALDRVVLQLMQSVDVRLGELGVGEIGERLAAPEVERCLPARRRCPSITASHLVPPHGNQLGEPADVNGGDVHGQPIARRSGLDHRGVNQASERLAQPGDVDLDRMSSRARRVVSHINSIRRSAETISFGLSANTTRRIRCLGGPRSTTRSAQRTSTAPSSRPSTTPGCPAPPRRQPWRPASRPSRPCLPSPLHPSSCSSVDVASIATGHSRSALRPLSSAGAETEPTPTSDPDDLRIAARAQHDHAGRTRPVASRRRNERTPPCRTSRPLRVTS